MADKMLRMAGRGDDGKAKALKTDNEGNLGVQLTGSNATLDTKDNRDLRGLNTNKPDATTVPIGATYWSIDTDPNAMKVEVSDGTQWKVME